ncbi:hypothetical protein BC833DRAFT_592144 [Globomyces pollinis-pini]|nr:hypothetical protein BC833DRAFT_592144 [Globomyces pollinis-pini]
MRLQSLLFIGIVNTKSHKHKNPTNCNVTEINLYSQEMPIVVLPKSMLYSAEYNEMLSCGMFVCLKLKDYMFDTVVVGTCGDCKTMKFLPTSSMLETIRHVNQTITNTTDDSSTIPTETDDTGLERRDQSVNSTNLQFQYTAKSCSNYDLIKNSSIHNVTLSPDLQSMKLSIGIWNPNLPVTTDGVPQPIETRGPSIPVITKISLQSSTQNNIKTSQPSSSRLSTIPTTFVTIPDNKISNFAISTTTPINTNLTNLTTTSIITTTFTTTDIDIFNIPITSLPTIQPTHRPPEGSATNNIILSSLYYCLWFWIVII